MMQTRELFETMNGADYVVIDGVLFETGYLRVPDEFTVADDVVLEARHGDTEIDMTRAEFEGAVGVGEGVFRLQERLARAFPVERRDSLKQRRRRRQFLIIEHGLAPPTRDVHG